MDTALFNRGANDLCEQRFRDEARFGMVSRGGSEGAAVATNELLAFALVEGRGASEILQNPERRFDPLLPRFTLDFEQMVVSRPFPHFSQGRAQLFRTEFSRENAQKKIQERPVGFRENLLRLSREGIRRMWFSKTGLRPRPMNQSVSFQVLKMRPHGIVREIQSRGQLVHRLLFCPEKIENPSPRAFD